MSESLKGRTSPTKGMTYSADTRRKMSESQKGKSCGPFSEEHRQKLRAAQKAAWAKRKAKETNS